MAAGLELLGDENRRLRHCINDLVSVLALPAMWTGESLSQIAKTLVDALLGMLKLDVIYFSSSEAGEDAPIEILRFAEASHATMSPQPASRILREWLAQDSQQHDRASRIRLGDAEFSIACFPLGLRGETGFIVAGSQRTDFPEITEKLVLNVAANQAAIGLHSATLLRHQQRLTEDLDRRVVEGQEALLTALDEIMGSEAKLRQVIDAIPTLAWCNLPDGPNEFLNRGWHEYTGLSPEQSNGWGWTVAFHPEDLPPLMERWREILVTGEPAEIEARLRRHDGAFRWFLIRAQPLRSEAGEILRWYGTSTDIDDLKNAQEGLRRGEALLAEGQRLSRTGTFFWRPETNEINCSPELYRICEIDPRAPATMDLILSRVHPDDAPMFSDVVARGWKNGADFEHEHRLLMPDHSVKYLHVIAHATRDPKGQLEYIGAAQDVTPRKLAEESLAKARSELTNVARVSSLGVLTASIAHEVNQPLSGVVTNAATCLRMLSSETPNLEGARETARRMIRDGNRASDVITRLRALYSKRDFSPEVLNLNDATKEVISLSLMDLHRNHVTLRHELDESLPTVVGDRVQLQQVILNFLRNAADAMSTIDDRPRELVIRTENHEENQIRLSVKDSGVGFTPHTADKIFEAFYTTKTDGMGIGLSISRSIIEAHQGRIWATPNDGPGCTFSFAIPRAS
jgi:PAS domain S-box-containing protein